MAKEPPFASLRCFIFFFVFLSPQKSAAQNATTDPSEVSALNAIFRKWKIMIPENATWNRNGDPCTGSATNWTQGIEDAGVTKPSIKCSCTFNNNKTCHIIQLNVQHLDRQGEIPEEITALKHLTYFKIDFNFFTGVLPAFLGNLSALQYLSIGHNAFHGSIPMELGNLKELVMLAVGSNNFSGTLPPELGSLVKLELLYVDSSGIGGEIPSTFANLRNLRIMDALDSPFEGKLPDFIGNWTKLTNLSIQGNSFEGPIPSSFSQLTSLLSLRISDIYNGSSSLDFVKNLSNLNELVLRNALVNGTIPSELGEFQHLVTLDLSFNNLTGQIPSSFFTMSNLKNLFLGNNSLSGELPNNWNANVEHIDVSYNFLSGSLPPWVTSISQLNLVANSFTLDESEVSKRLRCLQRNFPCNRDSPQNSNFGIKCGGPKVTGSSGIVYEADSNTLGPARFYVTNDKWAVSKVGLFADKTGKLDLEDTQENVTGTNENPELFHTARMSPGSLRYYGLGLYNGPYIVTLQFAEIGFPDENSKTWAGLAKRVFDIYIQGSRREKDFDITKVAGGVEKALVKTYNVTVTENYLEIHLFWAGKGTCCIPKQGYYGPLIAAVHAASDFTPNVTGIPQTSRKKKRGLIIGVAVSAVVVVLISPLVIIYMRTKSDDDDEEGFRGIGSRPHTFSYAELRAATEDFHSSNKLGEGGFGDVYKGTLLDGRLVAVKQLSVVSKQGKNQFLSEIATISVVQHRNLVKLYGCCIEGNRCILVYEHLENKSLDQALFGKNDLHLDWPTRFNICLGTARGLAYLHEESRRRIIHRDVKASNILLDDALSPKISDFGLAKLFHDNETHIKTKVAGTIGYLAPEYAMRGRLTEKADIFSFGIVALEIVSGRPNLYNTSDGELIHLLELAWTLHENNRSLELVDPTLAGFDEDEAIRMIKVVFLCTQASPKLRPSMSLLGTAMSKPSYLTDSDFNDKDSRFQQSNVTNTEIIEGR
ncbi:hypothetical protein UlMin_019413 [Ulmus minor]